MKITLSNESLTQVSVDLLAVGVHEGKLEEDENVQKLDKATGGALSRLAKAEEFVGKRGEALKVPSSGRVKARWIVLVGLGGGELTLHDARRVAVRLARVTRGQHSAAVIMPSWSPESVRAASEGLITGPYRYAEYLTGSRKPKSTLKSAVLLVGSAAKQAPFKSALEAGKVVGESINLVRDLVNAPPNDMNPPALADAAASTCKRWDLHCTVWNKKQIEKAGMNLLLAVNRGSGIEPRVVHMVYRPQGASKNTRKVAFVGKGLTFDSGGLCIKTAKGMLDMKCDMAGAAVTIGIIAAAARLKLPVEVHGVFGATENMSGDFAFRPGDVYRSLDGKTVEIINTDAEGRLVLADLLAWTRDLKPDYIVDHATLTGACMVALGSWTAGLFSNSDELATRYAEAARYESESVWRMPLNEDLRETLKSDIADLKHTGESYGGAITAALFLKEFVGNARWLHMDIAGPAFLERPHDVYPKGGTGFGVATGVRFLESLARS